MSVCFNKLYILLHSSSFLVIMAIDLPWFWHSFRLSVKLSKRLVSLTSVTGTGLLRRMAVTWLSPKIRLLKSIISSLERYVLVKRM